MLYSIPFSFPETYGGLAETDGIARFDGQHLTLEFQVRDAVFGVVKSEVKEILLPVEEIASVHYKRGRFSGRLSIRSHKIVQEIPVQKGGEFILSFKRRHRDEGEEFASILQLRVSEAKLKRLEEE
ncbi:MAG: hypothetical protein AB7H80_13805 [Candidatus Kapaibacterium sp.]